MNVFKNKDLGFLIIRMGLGLSFFIFYGWFKISGGPDMWQNIGHTIVPSDFPFLATFLGFLAAVTESVGAILLILGVLFKPVTMLLFITMGTATYVDFSNGNSFSHPLELAIIFLGLWITGPGKYVLQFSRFKQD